MSYTPAKFEKPVQAWAHPHEQPRENYLGLTGFIVSVVALVFTLGVLSPIGLLISLGGLFSRPRGYAIAGVVTGLLGSLWIVLVGAIFFLSVAVGVPMIEGAINHIGNHVTTASGILEAKEKVETYRKENDRLPEGIEGNKLIAECKDAKGNSIRYEVTEEGYALRSAGADGKFETEDDMNDAQVEAYLQAIQKNSDMSDEEIKKFQDEIRIHSRGGSKNPPEIELPKAATPK